MVTNLKDIAWEASSVNLAPSHGAPEALKYESKGNIILALLCFALFPLSTPMTTDKTISMCSALKGNENSGAVAMLATNDPGTSCCDRSSEPLQR
jgi:hypothetical protein